MIWNNKKLDECVNPFLTMKSNDSTVNDKKKLIQKADNMPMEDFSWRK